MTTITVSLFWTGFGTGAAAMVLVLGVLIAIFAARQKK